MYGTGHASVLLSIGAAIGALRLVACGGTVTTAPDDGADASTGTVGGDGSDASRADPDGSLHADGDRPIGEAGALPSNYIDGSGDCGTYDGDPSPIKHHDCCESRPCLGYCALDDASIVRCDCFGVDGGCPSGQVCCEFRRACTLPEACGLGGH